MSIQDKYISKNIGGSKLFGITPVFSHDSRWLFITSDKQVDTYSVLSGKRILTSTRHDSEITCIRLNQENELISSDSVGNLIIWDYNENCLKNKFKFEGTIKTFVVISEDLRYVDDYEERSIKIALILQNGDQISLTTSVLLAEGKYYKCRNIELEGSTHILHVLSDGSHLVLSGKHSVRIIAVTTLAVNFRIKFNKSEIICDLKAHPTVHDSIAVSFNSGRILVVSNIINPNNSRLELKWHVGSNTRIAYPPSGLYLLSAGCECVMVKWKVDHHSNDFLPRLPAPIRQMVVAPNSHDICMVHLDNTITFVNSNKQVTNSVNNFSRQWLKRGLEDTSTCEYPIGLLTGFSDSVLMTNGRIGCIQFFSADESRNLFQVDISRQNYVVAIDNEREAFFPTVTSAACVDDWLITSEYYHVTSESKLKFWELDKSAKSIKLTNFVDLLDRIDSIFAGKFEDFSYCVVCSGNFIQIWELEGDWKCKRELDCGFCVLNLRLSDDCSVMMGVVSKPHFDQITMWDFETLSIFPPLHCISKYYRFRRVEFCGESQRLLVLVTNERDLLIVDIIEDRVIISICDHNIDLVAQSRYFTTFAVFRTDGIVELIDAFTLKREILSENIFAIYASLFGKTEWTLMVIDENQNLIKICQRDNLRRENCAQVSYMPKQSTFGSYLDEESKVVKTVDSGSVSSVYSDYLMTLSSHMLPPVDVMCQQYFDDLIKTNFGI